MRTLVAISLTKASARHICCNVNSFKGTHKAEILGGNSTGYMCHQGTLSPRKA